MKASTKKWGLRAVKLAVCVGALWYLSGKVSINSFVRLKDSPGTPCQLVSETDETPDTSQPLTILDPATGAHREVSWDELASQEQLTKGQRPVEHGLKHVAQHLNWSWALLAILFSGPPTFVMAWRLRILLSTQKITLSMRDAILLTFAGNFFNFAMPGTTGGDIYKAYHIARTTHKGAEGVTIVFLDRVIGLISFLLLAVAAIFISSGQQMIGEYGRWVGYVMAAFVIGGGLFFSRRIRSLIHYDRLLQRLPFGDKLRRIDETAFNFRFHPRQSALALGGTIILHLVFVVSLYCLARGLGITPGDGRSQGELYLACLLCFVVGYLFAAIPISVQGFGLLEAVFIRVLVEGGWSSMNQMLAMALGIRILQVLWALPGIIVPWLGFGRPPSEESEVSEKSGESESKTCSP